MNGTKATTSEQSNARTRLAEGIRTDEPEDKRVCPHDDCHGSLKLTDSDRVVCHLCRCTPDGVFLPESGGFTPGHDASTDTPNIEGRGSAHVDAKGGGLWAEDGPPDHRIDRFGGGTDSPACFTPRPSVPPFSTPMGGDGWADDHHTYDGSGKTRLAGGYERVYDEDDDNRPVGVDDAYTFDLSTL